MTRFALTALAVLQLVSCLAEDVKTVDGKEYKNATISRIEPDGLVITMSYGIIKIPFEELSAELKDKYHFNADAAGKFRDDLRVSQEPVQPTQIAAEQQRESDATLATPSRWNISGTVLSVADGGLVVACTNWKPVDDPTKRGHSLPTMQEGTTVFVVGDNLSYVEGQQVSLVCDDTGDTNTVPTVRGAAKVLRRFRVAVQP